MSVMARPEDRQCKCLACGNIVLESEILTAQSPFDPDETLVACTKCKAVFGASVVSICDELGCNEPVTCGFPVSDDAFGDYRTTCAKHYRKPIKEFE